MASVVETCNRALQKLGASRITSLGDSSKNARACAVAFPRMRDSALRKHQWNFAVKRAELASSTTAPAFGYAYAYPLPSDFLRLLMNTTGGNGWRTSSYSTGIVGGPLTAFSDWQIEGNSIMANDVGPLQIRYIARIEDPNQWDILFDEMVACYMALEMCEELTQSNTKKADIKEDLKTIMADARRINAFESNAVNIPDDDWLLARY